MPESANVGDATLTFYWRPGCPFCSSLRRGLRRRGIAFEPVNIWDDPAAAARVREIAGGNETVPTVTLGEHELVNPGAGRVESLVREVAPHLIGDQSRRGLRRLWPFG